MLLEGVENAAHGVIHGLHHRGVGWMALADADLAWWGGAFGALALAHRNVLFPDLLFRSELGFLFDGRQFGRLFLVL